MDKVVKGVIYVTVVAVTLYYIFKDPKQTTALLGTALHGFGSGVAALQGRSVA